MKLQRSTSAPLSSPLIDAVMDCYVTWREESAAVVLSYDNWVRARREDRALAFAAYSAALDREERAAGEYQRVIELAANHAPIRKGYDVA